MLPNTGVTTCVNMYDIYSYISKSLFSYTTVVVLFYFIAITLILQMQ